MEVKSTPETKLFTGPIPWSWVCQTGQILAPLTITKITRKKPSNQSKVAWRPSNDESMTGQRLGTPTRTDGLEKCRLSASQPLVVSTYNVRTPYQYGKTHQLFTGCTDAGVDTVAVQEHRWITPDPMEELGSEDNNWAGRLITGLLGGQNI